MRRGELVTWVGKKKLSKKKREKGKQRGSSREARVTKEGAAILSGVGNLVIKKKEECREIGKKKNKGKEHSKWAVCRGRELKLFL